LPKLENLLNVHANDFGYTDLIQKSNDYIFEINSVDKDRGKLINIAHLGRNKTEKDIAIMSTCNKDMVKYGIMEAFDAYIKNIEESTKLIKESNKLINKGAKFISGITSEITSRFSGLFSNSKNQDSKLETNQDSKLETNQDSKLETNQDSKLETNQDSKLEKDLCEKTLNIIKLINKEYKIKVVNSMYIVELKKEGLLRMLVKFGHNFTEKELLQEPSQQGGKPKKNPKSKSKRKSKKSKSKKSKSKKSKSKKSKSKKSKSKRKSKR
jgi:hypothetical protein